jgi:hypothetical protein
MPETFEPVNERRAVPECRRRLADDYYAIFADWKGKRPNFPLGSEIGAAKEALAFSEVRNVKREDFGADKIKTNDGLTVFQWADCYLELEKIKAKRSFSREQGLIATIKRLLGSVLIAEVKRSICSSTEANGSRSISSAAGKTPPRRFVLVLWPMSCCLRHMRQGERTAGRYAVCPGDTAITAGSDT